ncbi:MAG TPA: tetratricopeptide repeat-containing protein [Rhizomicrobium sp.]|nr:tetratricopeptide repeat-containing protein [Rhizomicrobium sp.]
MPVNSSSLLSIIAHARSGALARAKAMFAEAGFERIDDDAAVLSVKGRLLKDEALAARGRERKRLYRESARAYARAGEIGGASYPLINAATLSLLAGERRESEQLARRILARGDEEAETPYWRAATRAEARLLLGETEAAKASLKEAVACAPLAHEDHASTLRQFGLILDELRGSKVWLDAFRPPRSLHFAGHMSLATTRSALDREIRKRIAEERIGFGYGALAAGADIVIAEALLETGAELHLVLPAAVNVFRAGSVARCGASWAKRFDIVAERACSIRTIGSSEESLSPLAIRLAAEVAMGSAIMQAETLMTEAVQLLILDRKAEPQSMRSASGAIARAWRYGGRRQHILTAPRLREPALAPLRRRLDRSERLVAVLRIDPSHTPADQVFKHILPRTAKIVTSNGERPIAPYWTGEAVIAAFDTPAVAADAALEISVALGNSARLRICGDYGVVRIVPNPFGGTPFLAGAPAATPGQIAPSTPDGAIHITEDFAAALCAGAAGGRPRVEFIGELPARMETPIRLFSLRR